MTAPENEKPLPDQQALQKALRYVAHTARSREETAERLRRWGCSEETVCEVVDHLERAGILDDRSLATVYIDEMLRKGYGYTRVRDSLFKKRIDRDLIEELLGEYPMESELERAMDTASGRIRGAGSFVSEDERGKITGFLMRRGYSRQVSAEAWREIVRFDTQNRRE